MDSDRIEAKLDRLIAMYEARGDRIKELEKAVEAEARQRVKDCNERNAYKRELRLVDSWENGYHTGIDAALAALTQKGEPRACTGCANGCAGCKGKGKPYGEELMRQLRQGQKGDNE